MNESDFGTWNAFSRGLSLVEYGGSVCSLCFCLTVEIRFSGFPLNTSVSYPFSAELTVEGYLHGVRIDSFLVRHFRNYTSYRMQRLVRAGQVRIEGVIAATDDRVYKGQAVEVKLVEPPDHLLPPEPQIGRAHV